MAQETYTHVRGFTFIQSTTPTSPEYLDTWYNTDTKIVKIYGCSGWESFATFEPGVCNYGYSMGGYDGSNYVSTIDRITFPFNSGTASHVGNLSGEIRNSAGCNSSNYGYCMSGYSSGYLSTIERITFPFNSGTASYVGNLSETKCKLHINYRSY